MSERASDFVNQSNEKEDSQNITLEEKEEVNEQNQEFVKEESSDRQIHEDKEKEVINVIDVIDIEENDIVGNMQIIQEEEKVVTQQSFETVPKLELSVLTKPNKSSNTSHLKRLEIVFQF
jgi:hypothetical protein